MGLTLRESMQLVSDPRNLDGSVDEVFRLMLGVHCELDAGLIAQSGGLDAESVTAVVGFGGLLSGACLFTCDAPAARRLAACMTGMDFPEVDDTVKDGIGELCNMLAGAWKSKVPRLAANCGLSVPAVISGRDYRLHVQAPEFELQRRFRFEDTAFTVTIVCDGLQ